MMRKKLSIALAGAVLLVASGCGTYDDGACGSDASCADTKMVKSKSMSHGKCKGMKAKCKGMAACKS